MLQRTSNLLSRNTVKAFGWAGKSKPHILRLQRGFSAPGNNNSTEGTSLKDVRQWWKVLIGSSAPRHVQINEVVKDSMAQTLRSKDFWSALPHILRNQPNPEEEDKDPTWKESFVEYWKNPQNRNYSLLAIALLLLALGTSKTIHEMIGIEMGMYRVITVTVD